jgi:hypothetical protein
MTEPKTTVELFDKHYTIDHELSRTYRAHTFALEFARIKAGENTPASEFFENYSQAYRQFMTGTGTTGTTGSAPH